MHRGQCQPPRCRCSADTPPVAHQAQQGDTSIIPGYGAWVNRGTVRDTGGQPTYPPEPARGKLLIIPIFHLRRGAGAGDPPGARGHQFSELVSDLEIERRMSGAPRVEGMSAPGAFLGGGVLGVVHGVAAHPAGRGLGRGATSGDVDKHSTEGVSGVFAVALETGPPAPAGRAFICDDIARGAVVGTAPLPIDSSAVDLHHQGLTTALPCRLPAKRSAPASATSVRESSSVKPASTSVSR